MITDMQVDSQIAFDYWNELDAKSRRIFVYKLFDVLADMHRKYNDVEGAAIWTDVITADIESVFPACAKTSCKPKRKRR